MRKVGRQQLTVEDWRGGLVTERPCVLPSQAAVCHLTLRIYYSSTSFPIAQLVGMRGLPQEQHLRYERLVGESLAGWDARFAEPLPNEHKRRKDLSYETCNLHCSDGSSSVFRAGSPGAGSPWGRSPSHRHSGTRYPYPASRSHLRSGEQQGETRRCWSAGPHQCRVV